MRHDFSAAGYKRARKAFVHKLPASEPFTHPAAVGPSSAAPEAQRLRIARPINARWPTVSRETG